MLWYLLTVAMKSLAPWSYKINEGGLRDFLNNQGGAAGSAKQNELVPHMETGFFVEKIMYE